MKIIDSHQRLRTLWGWIDRQHNEQIAQCIPQGSRVLDVGCGYGSLVNYLTERDHDTEGIDLDPEAIAIALQLFPLINVNLVDAEHLDAYPDASFDCVVLRDSFHHLLWEHDSGRIFQNIRRILKTGGKLIVWDPNPMWILRLARKIVHHVDPQAPIETARLVLDREKFVIESLSYYETIGLPLSGGYVGLRLVPNVQVLNKSIAALNAVLSNRAVMLGLGPYICWRYRLVART